MSSTALVLRRTSPSLAAAAAPRRLAVTRSLSSYVFDNVGGHGVGNIGINWPVTKTNTGFNIVPQGYKYVVERFGKMHTVEDSGWFLAIPIVDQISYVIDIRERAIDIPPQSAITRDNVSVEVSGNLFVKFDDPVKAAYGAFNPLYSVTQVRIIMSEMKVVVYACFLLYAFHVRCIGYSPFCVSLLS